VVEALWAGTPGHLVGVVRLAASPVVGAKPQDALAAAPKGGGLMAGSALAQFNAGLDRWINESVPAAAVAFHKKVHFMIGGCTFLDDAGNLTLVPGLLNFTRVDTGRARGNWQSSIGAPAEGTIDEGFGPPRRGREIRPAEFVGEPATAEETARAQAALAGLRMGQSTYWTNNLPYVVILNDGGVHRRQGDHMVERAMATTRQMLGGA
jgi:hypothetical protein